MGQYGMLTIGEFSHSNGRDDFHIWKCDCGNERPMNSRHVFNGVSKTCGCTRTKLKQEDKFNIALEYEAGAESKFLCEKYNASISVVNRAIKEYGVEIRDVLTMKQREEIKIRYELGEESKNLAKEYGVSSGAIRTSVLMLGGKMRAAGTPLILSAGEVEFAKEMYESGEHSSDIANAVGASSVVVLLALKKKGVKIRTPSECHKKYELNEDAFAEPTRDALYWAGFIAADGCVHKNQLSISLQLRDYDHLVKFKEFVGCGHEVKRERDRAAYTIKFKSPKICEDLKKYGVTERKSLTYNPPEFCKESPDFWRGMVDGDGCVRVGKDGKPTLFLCGSFHAVEGFKNWVRKFSDTKAEGSKHINIYQFSIYGRHAIPSLNQLHADNPKYFLDRKREAIKQFLDVYSHV